MSASKHPWPFGSSKWLVAAVAAALAFGGCGKRRATTVPEADLPQDQWSSGVVLYKDHCANCHGENGEGGEDTPALVGEGALPLEAPGESPSRTTEFRTALDVFAYTKETMPAIAPGELSDKAVWAILAFVFKEAELYDGKEPLDAERAAGIALR